MSRHLTLLELVELCFLHSLYDLQNCVKDQHKEVLKQFKGKIDFGCVGFWEM